MGLLFVAFVILVFIAVVTLRFYELGRNIGRNVEDVWIGSLPTIVPGDTNTNPIKTRVGEYGVIEYYRKAEKR